ncbi:MAG TPA: M28 family metallopeptidase [Candidatus Sulfotelmatobacter sp.]|nr:M28 family metallopeptidase [Candidatus Sulfotelmatobacter sp.]
MKLRKWMSLYFVLFSVKFFSQNSSNRAAVDVATKTIRPAEIRAHIRFLADSLLQGRAPGTPGYDIAARYVATELEGMGLHPAAEAGNWFQTVPLEKAVTDASASSFVLTTSGKEQKLTDAKDYILSTWFASPASNGDSKVEADVSAPVVFVGFGVTAPDQKYDDYAGVDVHGKIVAGIYGAPSSFPSTERAYYSDGVVKARNAVAHGAIGVISIMLPEDWKRYPWEWLVPQIQVGEMHWLDKKGVPHDFFPELRGNVLLSQQGADKLFAGAPKTLDQVFAAAKAGKPQAFTLPVSARIHTVAAHSVINSSNIVAELKGSDPALRDQYVVYTAHVDHLGICPAVAGDNVCHGALDNASGTSTLLEIARAYASLPQAPRRSVLFVFVTGEEMGLLGSDYFAHYPTVPLKAIVANVNIDGAPGSYFGMKDVVALGAEHSTIGDEVAAAAKEMGYDVSPDPMPEEVSFIRSDQYSFVLQGVPAVDVEDGVHATDPKISGLDVIKKWLVTRYHTPLDNMDQPIDFDSTAKGAVMNFLVGYQIAQHEAAPQWNKGDFFGTTFGPRHSAASTGE